LELLYNESMDRHKPARNPYLLISGVSGYILLAGFVNVFPPDNAWKISLFIIIFSVSSGLIVQYLFRTMQQSLLLGTGLALFLILRIFGLRSPIYAVLLLVCILSLELTLRKQ